MDTWQISTLYCECHCLQETWFCNLRLPKDTRGIVISIKSLNLELLAWDFEQSLSNSEIRLLIFKMNILMPALQGQLAKIHINNKLINYYKLRKR